MYQPHDESRNDDNHGPEGIGHDVQEDTPHVHVAGTVGVTVCRATVGVTVSVCLASSDYNQMILALERKTILWRKKIMKILSEEIKDQYLSLFSF